MAILGALGDLVLALSADTAKFQSDLGRADRVAKKFGREVGRALGNVAGMLVALGGSAGLTALVKNQIDAADAAGKLGQKIGISTEALSSYMVAARLSDVSNEQLQTGFQQLAKNQADFVAGTGEAASAFLALGISQEQVKALNGDNAKLFELVAGKMAQFEDSANKTAIAMKIFGRSGAELIPLINSLQKTRNEAAQLGAVIDAKTAASAERFNDNLTRVGIAVQAVGLNMSRGLLPVLEQVSEEMVRGAKAMNEFSFPAQAAKVIFQTLAVLGANVVFVFKGIGTEIGGIAAQLSRLAVLDFEGFAAIGKSMKEEAARARAELDAFEAKIMGTANSVAANAPETGKKLAAPALVAADAIKKAMAEAQKAAEKALELEEMATEDRVGASEALKNIDIENQRQRDEALKQTTDAQVESAEIATQIAEDTIYTYDKLGNRIEVTREQWEEMERQQKKNSEFAKEFGLTFSSALEDVIVKGGEASDMLKALEQDILRVITRKLVTEPLGTGISEAVKGVMGGSGIGDFFTNLFGSSVPNSGMAFAEGTDFVPRTGLAMVHQGEKIIPAEENARGGGRPMVIQFYGVRDMDSFRRNEAQISGDLALAMARARRNT